MPRRQDVRGHQERLSAAVWSVLAERGLAGLTVRAVAERAGCSTGLVMHTFPDKPALLRHARETLHGRTAGALDAAESGPGEPLRAVLARAVALTAETLEEARVWLGFSAAAVADPELSGQHVDNHNAFRRRIERLVGQARPDWPDERRIATATALVAVAEGLGVLAALDPAGYPAAVQLRAIDVAVTPLGLPSSHVGGL